MARVRNWSRPCQPVPGWVAEDGGETSGRHGQDNGVGADLKSICTADPADDVAVVDQRHDAGSHADGVRARWAAASAMRASGTRDHPIRAASGSPSSAVRITNSASAAPTSSTLAFRAGTTNKSQNPSMAACP